MKKYVILLLIIVLCTSLIIGNTIQKESFVQTETTLITHIYNESYLLPFWLTHHKSLFDNIIIIDYNSTDDSIEICRKICPHCKIVTSVNKEFDAENVDKEVMEIENGIGGIKMCLNVTEFLFCEKNIKDIFSEFNNPTSLSVKAYSPYTKMEKDINNHSELMKGLLSNDLYFHYDRGDRQIHNFSNGNYTVGRHTTNNTTLPTEQLHIIWLGYYPWNNKLLLRKLQIQQKIPASDKNNGRGFQHLYEKEKLISIIDEKVKDGQTLSTINPKLYDMILRSGSAD